MKSEWTKKKLSDIADFNPRETIKKGAAAKKISMDVLRPFCRDVPYYTEESFSGGTKFRNGDTIMARITPCLENGKTAQVSILNDGEVGFGSTEYIVFRAKEGIADKDYLYYLVCSPEVMLMYGKEASNRKQEIDRQHYTIPNQRPKDKHCGKI